MFALRGLHPDTSTTAEMLLQNSINS